MVEHIVTFSDEKTQKNYLQLRNGTFEEKKLFEQITNVLEKLMDNPYMGVRIQKRLIPKEFSQAKNLWKVNLPKGWRLLYTIERDEVVIITIILDWRDHKNYERKMKY